MIRRTHLLQIAATVTVALLLGACSDKEEPAAEDNSPEQGAACQLLDSEKISTATGEQVELVADLSADSQCAYQAGGGPVGVTVTLMDAATPAQFAALVTTDSQAEVPSGGVTPLVLWRRWRGPMRRSSGASPPRSRPESPVSVGLRSRSHGFSRRPPTTMLR